MKCEWCTVVLKTSITKDKAVQNEHRQTLDVMRERILADPIVSQLDADLRALEAELDEYKRGAWAKRNGLLSKGKGNAAIKGHSDTKDGTQAREGPKTPIDAEVRADTNGKLGEKAVAKADWLSNEKSTRSLPKRPPVVG